MRPRTIAIGDIHGCRVALDAVLAAVELRPDDTLVTLGDYIDRGPDSRGVIERLLRLRSQVKLVTLKGNHEAMLLNALDGKDASAWLEFGGSGTLASYGGDIANVPAEHRPFFHDLLPYYETERHIFVHANYAADIPLDEQPDYLLYWEHLSPWFCPPRHESGKTAIVGHTAQRSGEVLDLGHIVCIDTYCHGGGWLTALDVESGKIWQADRNGTLR
jgi:serine/threonine protein phosphatase 1